MVFIDSNDVLREDFIFNQVKTVTHQVKTVTHFLKDRWILIDIFNGNIYLYRLSTS